MSLVDRVVDKKLCNSCGVCSTVFPEKIKIVENNEFNFPVQKSKLNNLEEANFKNLCPGISQNFYNTGINHDDVWGSYDEVAQGYSLDKEIRHRSSSGGLLTELACFLLESKKVDGVIHVGSNQEIPTEAITKISYSLHDVCSNTGSRYQPVSTLDKVLQKIDLKKRYAIIGKPCEITALRNLIKLKPHLENVFVFKLSFFCAGTPSRSSVKKLIKSIYKNNDIKNFWFRGFGWPGKTTIINSQNKSFKTDYENSWGKILGPNINPRCKICVDGIGASADFVSADIWKSDSKGSPLFSEADGNGLILSRNSKSKEIIDEMVGLKRIQRNRFNISNLQKVQPSQFRRRTTVYFRLLAKSLVSRIKISHENSGASKVSLKYTGLKEGLRIFFGSIYRCFLGKL